MELTKLTETHNLTYYEVTLQADEAIFSTVSTYSLTLRDMLSNGYTSYTSDEIVKLTNDLFETNGISVSISTNTITLKFLQRATPKEGHEELPTIGFNSSEATLSFDNYTCCFYVPLLPCFVRTNPTSYVYNNKKYPDPVLPNTSPELNDRPDYNYASYSSESIDTNIVYDKCADWMYVNTVGSDDSAFDSPITDMVPLYCSDVYVYFANEETRRKQNTETEEWEGVSITSSPDSYLLNERTGKKYPITCKLKEGEAGDSFGNDIRSAVIPLNDNYEIKLYYKAFTQKIFYKVPNKMVQNSLRLDIKTESLPITYKEVIPITPPTPEEPDPEYQQDLMLCCRSGKVKLTDGTNTVEYNNQCYVYSEESPDLLPELNVPHVLQVYADTKQAKKNQFGMAQLRFVDLNKFYRKEDDTIVLKVYNQDALVFTITCKGDGTYTSTKETTTANTCNESMKIDSVIVTWMTETPWANIVVKIKDIDLRNDSNASIKCTAQVTPAVAPEDPQKAADQKSKQYAECEEDAWIRNNNKLIIDQWEQYKGFVLFSNSYLYLDGAYVGVKSLYAPAVNVRAAYIDCDMFITGEWNTTYPLNINAGLNAAPFNAKDGTVYPSDEIANATAYSDTLTSGDGKLYLNPNGHCAITLNDDIKIHNENPSYVKSIKRGFSQVNPVEKYNYSHIVNEYPDLTHTSPEYKGTETIGDKTYHVYEFDAQDKIVDYGTLHDGNYVKLHFKSGGEYHFDDINLDTQAIIEIDDLAAAGSNLEYVRICCEKFNLSNTADIKNHNGDLMSLMIYSRSDIEFAASVANSDNFGILVAPDGKVAFSNDIVWTGAIWAKEITMQAGCEFHSHD